MHGNSFWPELRTRDFPFPGDVSRGGSNLESFLQVSGPPVAAGGPFGFFGHRVLATGTKDCALYGTAVAQV